jgi:Tfp pilus assembly protein PilX
VTEARGQDGFALISAIIVMAVLTALGLALLMFANTQQRAATNEQSRESAYSLAEAALNAQIYQLSLQWPTEKNPVPTSCTEATSTSTNACPAAGSLSPTAGYPLAGTCTGTEAWGSSLSNRWTTYVRSDASTAQLFNSTIDKANAPYDNGDRSVWVRAVGVSRCKPVTVISKVAQQLVPLPFPRSVLSANGFSTSNSGSKVIINTLGTGENIAPQPASVSVRCQSPLTTSTCKIYTKGVQVTPDTTTICTACSPSLLTATQLESLKSQAKANGTYFKAGTCPTSMAALTGAPTYVEGPCTLGEFTGGVANSNASPGFLVLYNGTLKIAGNAVFYGVVYAVNAQKSSEGVVSSQGTGKIVGAIDVDGLGTVKVGSSAPNLVYDPRAFNLLKTYAGAVPTPNTFRVLPSGQ